VAGAWKGIRRRRVTRPKPGPAPEGYRADFSASSEAFGRVLDRAVLDAPGERGPGGVVVMPWVATPLPWYGMALGIALRDRGRPVTLIWDDTDFEEAGAPDRREQNELIGSVVDRLAGEFPVIRLSRSRALPPQDGDDLEVARLVGLNESWALRGGTPRRVDIERRARIERDLTATLARLRGALADHEFEYLVLAGGAWGSSGLFLLAGAEAGVRVSTYDAGQGWVLAANRGVASHQGEVADVFRQLWRDDLDGLGPWVEAGRDEFRARRVGTDRTEFQLVEAGTADVDFPVDVLVPMNVDHDAAALDRHVHFTDTTEWISETVAFVLERSEAHIVVRQHPSERRALERSRLDVGAHLERRFGSHPRVHYIGAEEPISTYDLLDRARFVVPFVSTIGIEAAALGKPVLPAGAGYYNDLGFVHVPRSRAEYFSLLDRGIAGTLPEFEHQTERAWLCYYLSQCCNRVWTDFTPQPADFWKWCEQAPEAVFASDGVADIVTSVDDDVPLALVRHSRRAVTRG